MTNKRQLLIEKGLQGLEKCFLELSSDIRQKDKVKTNKYMNLFDHFSTILDYMQALDKSIAAEILEKSNNPYDFYAGFQYFSRKGDYDRASAMYFEFFDLVDLSDEEYIFDSIENFFREIKKENEDRISLFLEKNLRKLIATYGSENVFNRFNEKRFQIFEVSSRIGNLHSG